MPKKSKGHKMASWRKYAKMAVSLVGKGVGAAIALSPTFRGFQEGIRARNLKTGTDTIVYDITGITPQGAPVDVGHLIQTGVLVGVGLGVMKLFSIVAKKV